MGNLRKLNLEALLRIVVLVGFAAFFTVIILNGSVQLYVHPRIVPYMIFGILGMLLIAAFTAKELFKPIRKSSIASYVFFIIPLFLAFAVPAQAMSSTSMAFGDTNLTGLVLASNSPNSSNASVSPSPSAAPDVIDDSNSEVATEPDVTAEDAANSPAPTAAADTSSKQTETKLTTSPDGTIMMGDGNFVATLQGIYANMDTYKGKGIQVIGFVYKDKQFSPSQFVAARMMMTCCTADLQPLGFLCQYDKTPDLDHDTWIKLTGTIDIIEFQGDKIPCIIVKQVEKTDKPTDEYVYPY
jgi:putative membrane protein